MAKPKGLFTKKTALKTQVAKAPGSKLGNFGGKAAKPFGSKASAEPKEMTTKPTAPKPGRMSADDKELGMGKLQSGGKRGHNTYT